MIPSLFWQATHWLLEATPAFAQATGSVEPSNNDPVIPGQQSTLTFFNPLDDLTVTDLLSKVLSGLTLLAIPIVTIMIIIGAYYIITSGGNPGRRTKGKDYILWAAVGFAVLLLADSVVAILQDFLQP